MYMQCIPKAIRIWTIDGILMSTEVQFDISETYKYKGLSNKYSIPDNASSWLYHHFSKIAPSEDQYASFAWKLIFRKIPHNMVNESHKI